MNKPLENQFALLKEQYHKQSDRRITPNIKDRLRGQMISLGRHYQIVKITLDVNQTEVEIEDVYYTDVSESDARECAKRDFPTWAIIDTTVILPGTHDF